jgi:hypothetical protein
MRNRKHAAILALLAATVVVGCGSERTITRRETTTTVPVETRRTTVETVPAAPVVETETTVRKHQERSTTVEY